MTRSTLLFFALFFYLSPLAQTPTFEWVKERPVLNGNSTVNADESLLKKGQQKLWFVSFDSLVSFHQAPYGNTIIESFMENGSTLSVYFLRGQAHIVDLVELPSGEIIIGGKFIDTLFINGVDTLLNNAATPQTNEFLISLHSNGTVNWKRNLTTSMAPSYEFVSLAVSPDDVVYYAQENFNNPDSIVQLDANGVDVFQIGIENSKLIGDFEFDTGGNILVSGSASNGTFKIGTHTKNISFSYAFYLAKINPSGNGSWSQIVEDLSFHDSYLAVNNTGEVFWTGPSYQSSQFGSFTTDGPDWGKDYFLTRLDSSGNFQWLQYVINPSQVSGDFDIAFDQIDCQPSGGVAIAGKIRGTVDFGNGTIPSNSTTSEPSQAVLFFNAQGQAIWHKNIAQGVINHAINDVIYYNGHWYINGDVDGNQTIDLDTISINLGNEGGSYFTKLDTPVGLFVGETSSKSGFKVFPNPGNHQLNIQSENFRSIQSLTIISIDGTIVQKIDNPSQSLNVSALSPGTYLIQILDGNNTLETVRWIKQ